MTVAGILLRILVRIAIGAVVGAMIGSLVTGDWVYTIGWAVGLPVLLTIGGISGSRGTTRRVLTAPGRVPGIIGSLHARAPQTTAVLNPEPTSVPSPGLVLNGSPVAAEARIPTPPPRGDVVPWWSRAVAVAAILVGLALALVPAYRTIGWIAQDVVAGRWDGRDMRSGVHQQEAVDDIAATVGSYDFVSVTFFDSYVIVDAPTSPGATTTDEYIWRYGRATREGPAGATLDGLFDASRVDFSIIGDVVAAAKADTGWEGFTTFYPSVRANDAGVPEIFISLGTDYYSAGYTYSIEGELLDRYGDGLD